MNKNKYQKYINNFRREFTLYLKPGVGLSCNIYPSNDGGAILEFSIGEAYENDDDYKEISKSLGLALANIEQHAFGGNLEGFSFGGTNTILERNRVIYIKESNPKEWSESAAKKDVKSLISDSQGTRK